MDQLYRDIYIDYIGSIPTGRAKYHGGSNYTKRVILDLLSLKEIRCRLHLIWPKGYIPIDELEKSIYNSEKIEVIETNEICNETPIKENSIIFFPLVRTKRFKIFRQVKKWFPSVKVYFTNHDIRPIDLKPDIYDRFYAKHYSYIFEMIKYIMRFIGYQYLVKKYFRYVDKLFTVSNDALQKMIRITYVPNIKYFYENIMIDTEVSVGTNIKFILFLSGGRQEKNFARALEAFCKYKQETNNDVYLLVTGVSDELFCRLTKNNRVDDMIARKWVIHKEYVSYKELSELYLGCLFLFYPSKNEGFGLPVLEAALYGKKSLCSICTSIPEVLGSAGNYINPYDISNMIMGLKKMENNVLDNSLFDEKINVIKQQMEIDKKIFCWELMN